VKLENIYNPNKTIFASSCEFRGRASNSQKDTHKLTLQHVASRQDKSPTNKVHWNIQTDIGKKMIAMATKMISIFSSWYDIPMH
jgi:hypothetical protein